MSTPAGMVCPSVPAHGQLVQRHRTTPEQDWCGEWWGCQRCTASILVPSEALTAQLTTVAPVQGRLL